MKRPLVSHARMVAISTGILLLGSPLIAVAASSWNPTLLVNTESFQTIDEGDGTTNVEIRFGQTLNQKLLYNRTLRKFQFTSGLSVGGDLTATGSITASGAIRAAGNLSASGTLSVDGNATFKSAVNATGNITTKGVLSGNTLRVSGSANITGPVGASGSIYTDGNGITINNRANSTDDTLTFGNATANQSLKFLNSGQKFQFSNGVSVQGTLSGSALNVDHNATVGGSLTASGNILTKGNLSGSTLNVSGNFTWHGQSYVGPTSQSANTFLKTDGNGNLTWSSAAVGNGSGNIMSLHPEYPNAVYFASGSTDIGQLTAGFDSTNKENYYHWTSSKGTLQDYWIAIRVRVPNNFNAWDPVKPIEFRYRTGASANTTNYLNVKMLDTAGNPVSLTGGSSLASTSWTTAAITGVGAGTFTKQSFFTIWIKLSTTSGGSADAGYLNLNYSTTTP